MLRTTREALAARLRDEEHLETTPSAHAPEGLIVAHGGSPASWAAFADGACVVQDEASMLVARLLEPAPGETVADVCAAPGTKTTHLAQLMENRGRILAFDPQPARLALVTEAAARLGVTIVEIRGGTVEALAPGFADACDAALVDAPCSNLGVLRRNPEVKWRRRPEDLAAAAARQREILAAAAAMVRPGGRLVYATCSLEPEENEHVVAAFLAARSDFAPDRPAGLPPALERDGRLQCLPHVHGTDGFTAVRLRRVV
jgi:16S rRNA (cytosine967-C5)-methyltransferase